MFTPLTKQRMITDTESYLQILRNTPPVTPCKQCDHFIDGYCNAFDSNPPENFYEQYCELFYEIPF